MLWLFSLVGVLVALAVFAGGLVSCFLLLWMVGWLAALIVLGFWLFGCFGCFG